MVRDIFFETKGTEIFSKCFQIVFNGKNVPNSGNLVCCNFVFFSSGEFHISVVQPRHPPSQISFKFGTIVGPNGIKKITKFQLATIYHSQITSIWNLAQNGLFTLDTRDLKVNGHAKTINNLTYRCVNIKIGTGKFWMVRNPKIQLKIPKSKPKCLNFDFEVKNIKICALNLEP